MSMRRNKKKYKKGKRKIQGVQGVPQSQTAALPRHQEATQAQIEQMYEKH